MTKVIAVFIALNAGKTLKDFYRNFPKKLVDDCILVDDNSDDNTFELAMKLGIKSYRNPVRLGYGGNMKKALQLALNEGADVIIDLHPDGEYNPDSIPAALEKIRQGSDLVLGNRFFEFGSPVKSGMYKWKVFPILLLNLIDRIILGINITDFHQGFRVYTKKLLKGIDFKSNSDNYLFSFELIVQSVQKGMVISEVPVQTSYRGKKRGASIKNSIRYSLGTFKVLGKYLLGKYG